MTNELWQLGVVELAAAIREKQVSSREVIQAHLDRIATTNHKYNAVTVVLQEEALQVSDKADQELARGAKVGPLHGIPMTIKENIDLTNSPTTDGVVGLKDEIPPMEAAHITQLKQAGAIPIGRTNLPDFGLRLHTDNALRGATKNPWDPSRTPGGSSGGDAVALAIGMTPLGLGNDSAGSLRYPAQCCGITAIRPTVGRVAWATPDAYPITLQLFGVQGPMARHIQDLRVALAAMSGPDARDPWWTPAPQTGPMIDPPIKVAMTTNPGSGRVDSNVAEGVRTAAKLLSDAGYVVEEIEPPALEEAFHIWWQLAAADIRVAFLPDMEKLASPDALTFIHYFLELPPEATLSAYIQAFAERKRIARKWTQFALEYPLLLGPVSTMQPFPIGFDISGKAQVDELMNASQLVVSANLFGLPAVAVPVGVADGLPQGVQIIGSRYREDLCLDAAEAIERQAGVFTPIDLQQETIG